MIQFETNPDTSEKIFLKNFYHQMLALPNFRTGSEIYNPSGDEDYDFFKKENNVNFALTRTKSAETEGGDLSLEKIMQSVAEIRPHLKNYQKTISPNTESLVLRAPTQHISYDFETAEFPVTKIFISEFYRVKPYETALISTVYGEFGNEF